MAQSRLLRPPLRAHGQRCSGGSVPRPIQVHWVYPYEQLKPSNVQATVECLKLASVGPALVPITFVSSTSVFDAAPYIIAAERVLENDDLAGGVHLAVGYGAPARAVSLGAGWLAPLTSNPCHATESMRLLAGPRPVQVGG